MIFAQSDFLKFHSFDQSSYSYNVQLNVN